MESQNIQQAKQLAHTLLSDQQRMLKDDTYYLHSVRVFNILCDCGIKDEATLIAALLHNAELDPQNKQIIENMFSPEILDILIAYKNLVNLSVDLTTQANEAYALQTFINTAGDVRALLIRLADKVDNSETAFALDQAQKISSANKSLKFYVPLAKLLGIQRLAARLENAAFKTLNPQEHYRLEKILSNKAHLAHTIVPDVKKFIGSVLDESNITTDISYRVKSSHSTYKKLRYYLEKSEIISKDLSEIKDLVAMRILVSTIDECYIVENLLHEIWDSYSELRDDYIVSPRKSGYQSIHNIFKIHEQLDLEIQIKTHSMHEINEFGPAAHFFYKLGDKGASSSAYTKLLKYTQENKLWIKDLVINDATLDYSQKAPFANNVYAITPKGDIIELPKGATLLDFAYAIHSDVGSRCMGGYVNGSYVGLKHVINDGDKVEIKKGKKVNANPDWLNIVKTARARFFIKRELRKLEEK